MAKSFFIGLIISRLNGGHNTESPSKEIAVFYDLELLYIHIQQFVIKIIMIKMFEKILSLLNLKLINKKNTGTIDKRELDQFNRENNSYKLYFEGLSKSQNVSTDNFFKQSRHLDLINLVKKVLENEQVYDFAECGCWRGHSSYLISELINQTKKQVKFHIFDNFEGLSKDTDNDEELKKIDKNKVDKIRSQFTSSEDFVKNTVLKKFDFIEIYKGWIPEKFYLVNNCKFSFVHIDVDLYEPTLQSLEFFFPRLVDGGIMICDDYNLKLFDGSKKAWDEFFSKNKTKFNFSPSLSGSFIIK